jgi:YggT family protein
MDFVLVAVFRVVQLVLNIYIYIVVARALISWVNPDPYNPIVRFLHNATDPVLYRLRKVLPFSQAGGFDLSPMILIFLIYLVMQFINKLLYGFHSAF